MAMTNKEILDEVYSELKDWKDVTSGRSEGNNIRIVHDKVNSMTNFIEQEWQKADDQELVDQYNRNRKPEDWIKDVSQIVAPPPSWEKEEWYHSYPAIDPCEETDV